MSTMRGSAQFAREMDEAKADLAAYLTKNWELSPRQVLAIRQLPPANLGALRTALDRAVAGKMLITVTGVGAKDGCTELRFRITGNALTIQVV